MAALELSLYQLAEGSDLLSLIEFRQEAIEAQSPEDEIKVIDEQIALYIAALPAKVDSVRHVWRRMETLIGEAEEEQKFQAARKRTMQNDLDRLKDYIRRVMELQPWIEGKPKKLTGRTGSILLKGNGGTQAVEVSDPSLVPEEYHRYAIDCSGAAWAEIWKTMGAEWIKENVGRVSRTPVLSLIGEALQKPCETCEGGSYVRLNPSDGCPVCGGSGKQGVPGAKLSPRSSHVECR